MEAISGLQILIGGTLALIVAVFGWRFGWLDLSGAFAALGMGVIVFGLGGLRWSIVLLVFFISSSLFSKLFSSQKSESDQYAAKGARRDSGQVLANGGVASLFVILHVLYPQSEITWLCFTAAFAAANADTWATEIGLLASNAPILITSRKKVSKGTSGGITLAGSMGAAAGSGLIVLTAWWVWPQPFTTPHAGVIMGLFLAGLLASFVDSLLGATLQRVNYCPACKKETEKSPQHGCGTATEYLRGWRWLDNDWVNFFCTLSAALMVLFIGAGGLI
jgi:uncharacterized protein (TIGR00297 family)